MHVTNIKASFRRQVQPADYESAVAEVEFSATVEGDEYAEASATLLAKAREQVLAAVGKKPRAAEPVEEKAAEKTVEPAAEAKTKRKRRTKAEIEADEKAAEEVESGGHREGEPERPGKTTPDAEEDPAAVTDEEAEEMPEPITDVELQRVAAGAAKKATGGTQAVKDLMGEFGVGRLGELEQARRQEFVDRLGDLA